MNKSYNYTDCYRILSLAPDCSRDDLRKSYKRLIQKWHPDRFTDGSKEKSAADDKIKIINIAYNQLQSYYRKTGELPKPESQKQQTKKKQTEKHSATQPAPPKKETNQQSRKASSQTRQQHDTAATSRPARTSTARRPVFTGIMTLMLLAATYFIFTSSTEIETNKTATEPQTQITTGVQRASPEIAKTKTSRNYLDQSNLKTAPMSSELTSKKAKTSNNSLSITEQVTDDPYFTQGSSLGEVINIQGAPSKTDGDIWYYGDSEVHFVDGEVSHWIRKIGHPIKARIQTKP